MQYYTQVCALAFHQALRACAAVTAVTAVTAATAVTAVTAGPHSFRLLAAV